MDTTTAIDPAIHAAVEAEARADAAAFVDEFGEALNPTRTDWDAAAWDLAESRRAAVAAGVDDECWPIYQHALVEETQRIVGAK